MTLRPLEVADAAALFALVDENRAYLRQWLPWLDKNTTVADTLAFIALMGHQRSEGSASVFCVVSDGILVGLCGFNRIDWENRYANIGYWIAERSSGRGLAVTACRRLESLGFDEMGLNKLQIHVAEGNLKSRRVAEKLGFVATGTLRDAE